MIEIGIEDKKTITLPPEVVDPDTVKRGQKITKSVSGIVTSISEHGVTIELGEDEDEDSEWEDMEDKEKSEAMSKKMKKKMQSNKLEEYE